MPWNYTMTWTQTTKKNVCKQILQVNFVPEVNIASKFVWLKLLFSFCLDLSPRSHSWRAVIHVIWLDFWLTFSAYACLIHLSFRTGTWPVLFFCRFPSLWFSCCFAHTTSLRCCKTMGKPDTTFPACGVAIFCMPEQVHCLSGLLRTLYQRRAIVLVV